MLINARPALLLNLLLATPLAAQDIAAPPPVTLDQLVAPEGFVIEQVAGPPLVNHPTMASFDDQGRLYVCDGPGLNMPAKELLEKLPNMIRRLEDSDGDGKFDKATDYASKMTFPMGAAWYQGAVYTASPPNIWRLRDTDGDGVADERKILVSEFGFTGNAADIHGCFLGPDGRVYWCDGRHGHNFVDEKGNQISKGLAARLFSCKLDGSDVEAFAGGGMDNPVEVTFTTEGEPLGTVAYFDIVEGRHDAIVHWIYGGVYPRQEQTCLAEFKRTGDLLQPVSRFAGIAPAGITRYQGAQFGPDFRDNLFYVGFNSHGVVRGKLSRAGGSFAVGNEDFLKCDNPDFHPTDVLEDADGSLLVIDTGGWFRIGCPTSRIAKPEVLGGIYRIRRKDAEPISDPRGLKLQWAGLRPNQLAGRLSDARPAVRERATSELALKGDDAVGALAQLLASSAVATNRARAVWALTRIDTPASREAIRDAIATRDPSGRQIAARAAGTLRDEGAVDQLLGLLNDKELPVRREAATALGRIGDRRAVPALLAALQSNEDRAAEHAAIFALIQLNDRAATLPGLTNESPQIRRAALIALDQMPDGQLARELVAPLVESNDAALQKAALNVIQRREGWAAETVSILGRWLAESSSKPERQALIRSVVLPFAGDAQIQGIVAAALSRADLPSETRLLLLTLIAETELKALPESWLTPLKQHLASSDLPTVRQTLATISARGGLLFDEQLVALAADASRPEELRLSSISILAKHGAPLSDASFELLIKRLTAAQSPIDRLSAADALGYAKLAPEQYYEVVKHIAQAGPLELPALLRTAENTDDRTQGSQLVASLQQSPGFENLTVDRLRKLFAMYPTDVQSAAESLYKRLNADLEAQRARLSELAANLAGGDPVRGKLVFAQQKVSCSACHKAQNLGAIIGPDLSKIGQLRSLPDLLESVVFPNASFARGYESYSVVTASGTVFTGILSRETADSVYLRNAQREEVRIPRSDIEEFVPSKLSIMPQGLDKQLSPQELRDLFAFLQSLK